MDCGNIWFWIDVGNREDFCPARFAGLVRRETVCPIPVGQTGVFLSEYVGN